MRRLFSVLSFFLLFFVAFGMPAAAFAQEGQPVASTDGLSVFTAYPAQTIGLGETVTYALKLTGVDSARIVQLDMDTLPAGWTATFRGTGKLVQSVTVQPDVEASVDLKLEPPADVKAGTFNFVVAAMSEGGKATLPLQLVIKEKLPPRLSFEVELPTLKGTPTTAFRYNVTLFNEGEEDLLVSLSSDAVRPFRVIFQFNSQEVTELPIAAGENRRLTVEASAIDFVQGGSYPFSIRASSDSAQAETLLTAEVTGQVTLNLTTPDGRLSGQAYSGRDNTLKLVVQNTGSAPASAIELSSSAPTGWKVEFSPDKINELGAGQQVEVNVNLRPSDQAVAGDYVITLRAVPADSGTRSSEFRITVLTSTLWGVVGVALIAVAVIVVAVAVLRFGRR